MKFPTIVVLAAGENSRFFPLNTFTHKGALTLMGKPLVVRTLENLEQAGCSRVVMVISPKDADGKGLSRFLAEYEFKMEIVYVVQSEALGMGDALLQAKRFLHDPFGVIFPYMLDAGDVMLRMLEEASDGGAIAVSYTKEPWLYGVATLEEKRIIGIVEKPSKGKEPSNLRVRGMYYLSPTYLPYLERTPGEYNFESALDTFFQDHQVNAVELSASLPSLKYPWHLFDFQHHLFSSLPQYVSPYATVAKTALLDSSSGPIYIENGASIGHCTKIVGPAFIGKDVQIGDFSLVRSSSFEEGSSVGVYSDVTRSIVLEQAKMHNGFLGDSIVGRDVRIGAGLITSNKRIDRQNVQVNVKNQKIDRGHNALGTVIGDDTKIGIRVNIMPGKFIGARSLIYPSQTIWSHVPHDSIVKDSK